MVLYEFKCLIFDQHVMFNNLSVLSLFEQEIYPGVVFNTTTEYWSMELEYYNSMTGVKVTLGWLSFHLLRVFIEGKLTTDRSEFVPGLNLTCKISLNWITTKRITLLFYGEAQNNKMSKELCQISKMSISQSAVN